MKDSLGDRIKDKFENVTRFCLPQRTYGIVRIDGKAFHTFTRGLERPYCKELADAMDMAAKALAQSIMGCKLAYGQSDEYSFMFTDLDKDESEMWFAGNVQKIASVSASIFTAHFNTSWNWYNDGRSQALFDARVFVIPSREEVVNYFIWRQLDATRNSLNMLASCHFSHKQLQGKKSEDKHDMLHNVGVNWNDMPIPFKRGRVIRREPNKRTVSYIHKKTKETKTQEIEEMAWVVDQKIPMFTRDKSYMEKLI
jgi:tRNA(His) 5'-end guanylyltransferase